MCQTRQPFLKALCCACISKDAFGFGIFAPFVPVLAKTFGMTARNIAGAEQKVTLTPGVKGGLI